MSGRICVSRWEARDQCWIPSSQCPPCAVVLHASRVYVTRTWSSGRYRCWSSEICETWALESLAVVRRLGLRPTQCATTNRSGCYHARAHPSGYRQCEELADRLRFIKGSQRFGLRLEEIKELLDIQD